MLSLHKFSRHGGIGLNTGLGYLRGLFKNLNCCIALSCHSVFCPEWFPLHSPEFMAQVQPSLAPPHRHMARFGWVQFLPFPPTEFKIPCHALFCLSSPGVSSGVNSGLHPGKREQPPLSFTFVLVGSTFSPGLELA